MLLHCSSVGFLFVSGCMRDSAWRGIMRSLDNFSSSQWQPLIWGSWPPQLAGTTGGESGSVYDPVRISSIVKFELQAPVKEKTKKKKLEPPAWSGSCPHAFKAHSLHTDKPSQIVSGRRKHVHVTGWEGTQRSCGGDRVIWLQTLPVSCRLEFYAGRWSLQLALCCCQRNEHVRLSLPVSSWLGIHANSDAKLMSDIFSVFMGKKEVKHNLFGGFAL